jgi:hypothetical protein
VQRTLWGFGRGVMLEEFGSRRWTPSPCGRERRCMQEETRVTWQLATYTRSTKAREPDESGQLVLADQGSSKLWRPTKRLLLPNEK